MKQINVGIVGYGNLGKSVEKILINNKNFKLVAIFSRRNITSPFNTKVENYKNFINYKNKIEVMLLCGGSKNDLEVQTPELIEHFDVINTFDTHKKIPTELKKLNLLAKNNNKRAIICCGWDPGIFSIIRGLFVSLSNKATTFWGKGLSMGHSDAIRQIVGVKDAIQFTIPNKKALKLAFTNKLTKSIPMHFRECYVVADKNNRARIEKEIKEIPNYFKGQPTKVNFVSQNTLNKLKQNTSHKGQIISSFITQNNTQANLSFSVDMQSNPDFTATIVVSYIKAIFNFKQNNVSGAFTPLDVPISYLFFESEKQNLIELYC